MNEIFGEPRDGYEWVSKKTHPIRDGFHNTRRTVEAWLIRKLTGDDRSPIIFWSFKVVEKKIKRSRRSRR